MSQLSILFESALGFALFEVVKFDEISLGTKVIQQNINDVSKFSKVMKLKAFLPFTSAQVALENMNAVSEGEITTFLADWLEQNVHSPTELGVCDIKIGNAISTTLGIKCCHNELVMELLRGIRQHFVLFLKGITHTDVQQARLGLCHSYSRSKVKFNVHKLDAMITSTIGLFDQLDKKDVNTVSVRAREWYGMHFPELGKITTDNYQYIRVAHAIGDRKNLRNNDQLLQQLASICNDESLSQRIVDAAKVSMGVEFTETDWLLVNSFIQRVLSLHEYRNQLHAYLTAKMKTCAPNVTALIGETIGARLIAKAGSLTNLAKLAASTVQLLGAENALFRSLKKKTKTPKYGAIFESSFIGRAAPKDKARIARNLANKTAIAARIDCFTDDLSLTDVYGQEMRKQVEERLLFYKSGHPPRKNTTAMFEAKTQFEHMADELFAAQHETKKQKVEVKSEEEEQLVQLPKSEPVEEVEMTDKAPVKKEKKDKKDKKDKRQSIAA